MRFGAVKVRNRRRTARLRDCRCDLDDLDPKAVRVRALRGWSQMAAEPSTGKRWMRAKSASRPGEWIRLSRAAVLGRPAGLGLYRRSDTTLRRRCRIRRKTHESCGSDDPLNGRQ